MDTNEKNAAARRLYARLGYREAGIVPCVFNGIKGVVAGVPGEKTVSRGRSLCIQSLSSLLPSSPFFSITTALPLAVTAKTYGWYDIPPVASKSFVCGSSVI